MKKSRHQARFLIELVRQKAGFYIGSVVAVSLATVFMFLVPTLGKVTIDSVLTTEAADSDGLSTLLLSLIGGAQWLQENLWAAGVAIVVTTALGGLFMYVKDYLAARACEDTVRTLRERLFDHIHRLDESYLNQHDSGDIVQRCTSDIDTLRQFLTVEVMDIGRTLILMAIMIPLMIYQSWMMSVLALVLVPVVFAFAWIFFGKVRHLFQEVDEAEGQLTTLVQENLTGIRVVRAFARQDYECEKFDEGNRAYSDLHYKLIRMLANFWASSDLLCIAQNGILLIGGAYLAATNVVTVGTYFAFIGYTNLLIWPIRQLGQQLSEAGKATVSIGRIQEILNAPEEPEHDQEREAPVSLSGDILFDQVNFGFDADKPVIKDFSCHIKAGESIAIVGPTGAGKSTLVQLLLRLYDYQSGAIYLDGEPLHELSRKSVRKRIGTLLQEPFLFSRSLKDNIKFGRHSATDAEMVQSSTDAAVHQTIQSFAKKYDTVIGERGVSLSGGQKQRVTLSRTLLRDAAVLILDDTLSAVDAKTEQRIIAALQRKRGDQTLIIITHRLSVCQHTDRVLVIEQGRLSAQGTHAQLAEQPGFYQQLWQIQNSQIPDIESLSNWSANDPTTKDTA